MTVLATECLTGNYRFNDSYVEKQFNPLPIDKILDWCKLKAFADDKLKVNEKLKFDLGRVENIVTSFFPFPTMFSTGFFFNVVKSWDCVVKH